MRRNRARRPRPYRLCLELLEGRCLPSVFTVTTAADNGDNVNPVAGSLRQAILNANANPNSGGPDRIEFNIPGSGVHTIQPTAALPTITDPVVIDGYTQPKNDGSGGTASANTNPLTLGPGAAGTNAVLLIELNGSQAGTSDGLTISAGGSTITGLVINGFNGSGIVLNGNGGDVITGDFVGTDAAGDASLPNAAEGVDLLGSSNNNRIGGTSPADRNVISGNNNDAISIQFGSSSNLVQGNLIGTDHTGTRPLGNGSTAIFVDANFGPTSNNTIGGSAAGAGNVISANTDAGGIALLNGTTGNVVQGNFIGTDVTGTVALGNDSGGVIVSNSSNNTIGGTDVGAGNLIAFNGLASNHRAGVLVIGSSTGDAILSNSIHDNAGLGIDLGNTGVPVQNDSQGHTGPNNFQNFPVLTGVTVANGSTTITGTLHSDADLDFTLQFFADRAPDPSCFGEGETLLGTEKVHTAAESGSVSFTFTAPTALADGQFITATATDPGGNTSEFADDLVVGPKAVLQFSAAQFSAQETDGTATITVTRSGGVHYQVFVSYATSDGTAQAGTDYKATSGTLMFNADETTKTFTIPLLDDKAGGEGDQTVNLALSDPHCDALLGAQGTAVLTLHEEPRPQLQFGQAAYSVNEGNGSATITVTRTSGDTGAASVHFATSDGTATAGTDYTASSGTLHWAAGDFAPKTFTVPIRDDGLTDGNQTVNLALSSPTGGDTLGPLAQAVLTIVDPRTPPPPVSVPAPPVVLQVTALDPPFTLEAAPHVMFTVFGTGFAPGAVLLFDGRPMRTVFVSDTRLVIPNFVEQVGAPVLMRGRHGHRRRVQFDEGTGVIVVVVPGLGVSAPLFYEIREAVRPGDGGTDQERQLAQQFEAVNGVEADSSPLFQAFLKPPRRHE